jgi:hypothetical protein
LIKKAEIKDGRIPAEDLAKAVEMFEQENKRNPQKI